MVATKSITIENVYDLAKELSPRIVRNLGFNHLGAFGPEDVCSSYVIKVLEKGYLKRFNPKKGSLKNYVYQGLKNTAISMIRKVKYELEHFSGDGNNIMPHLEHKHELKRKEKDIAESLWLDEVIEKVGAWRFGKKNKHGFMFDKKYYAPTPGSVITLLAAGFNKRELAQAFKVSETTIINVIEKMRNKGLTKSML